MPRIIACRSSGDIDWAAATSCAVGPAGRPCGSPAVRPARFRRGAPPRLCATARRPAHRRAALASRPWPPRVAALQRGFGAVEAGARIVGGLGELGLCGRCHGAAGCEHQHFAELGMQLRLIRLEGDRAAIGIARFGEALQERPRSGPAEPSPLYARARAADALSADRPRQRVRPDRAAAARPALRQPAGRSPRVRRPRNRWRGPPPATGRRCRARRRSATRASAGLAVGDADLLGLLVGCRQHAPGDLGPRIHGLFRRRAFLARARCRYRQAAGGRSRLRLRLSSATARLADTRGRSSAASAARISSPAMTQNQIIARSPSSSAARALSSGQVRGLPVGAPAPCPKQQ